MRSNDCINVHIDAKNKMKALSKEDNDIIKAVRCTHDRYTKMLEKKLGKVPRQVTFDDLCRKHEDGNNILLEELVLSKVGMGERFKSKTELVNFLGSSGSFIFHHGSNVLTLNERISEERKYQPKMEDDDWSDMTQPKAMTLKKPTASNNIVEPILSWPDVLKTSNNIIKYQMLLESVLLRLLSSSYPNQIPISLIEELMSKHLRLKSESFDAVNVFGVSWDEVFDTGYYTGIVFNNVLDTVYVGDVLLFETKYRDLGLKLLTLDKGARTIENLIYREEQVPLGGVKMEDAYVQKYGFVDCTDLCTRYSQMFSYSNGMLTRNSFQTEEIWY